MQFLHPEFLYFLFLLIVPIIVHLFQLRKFRKTPFTNVAFLKKVVFQTRKSSQLKKWLTLLARLLALTCIILAFAQPFLPQENSVLRTKETVIYLDNSFSMQLEGKRGELLKRAVQELLETMPPEKEFTLLTNDRRYKNTTITKLKNELLQLEYANTSPSLSTILFRANNEFGENPSTLKTVIGISDFQENSVDIQTVDNNGARIELVQLSPVNTDNVSVDSVFIAEKTLGKSTLGILISHTGNTTNSVPLALYNGKELLAKTSVDFDGKKSVKTTLTLTNPPETIRGKVVVEDQGLQYDNTLYFSINKPEKIKVIALAETQKQNEFLDRIYDKETFEFISFAKNEWDYNKITTANTIILNGLQEIPSALLPILKQLEDRQGTLVIIPPAKNSLDGYATLSLRLETPKHTTFLEEEKKITDIVFAHPLYQHVFDDRVDNFQYPSVQSSWQLQGNAQSILKFSNGTPFLAEDGNVYIFTANLSDANSNFQNSPLIVPTFYNLAKQSLKLPELYYTIGEKAVYTIHVPLQKEEIVSIENEGHSFIPVQQSTDKQVQITTETRPADAGIYDVVKGDQKLGAVAYNYGRKESNLTYAHLEQWDRIELSTDVGSFFVHKKEQNEIHELWKWFVIFAIFFLLTELLLLKFLK